MNEYTREEGGEEVQDGEGVKRLVHNVESGDLCGDATTPSEMTAGRRARLVNELQISFDAPEPSAAYQP